ncbi:MAG: hypothetical protein IJZ19_12065 [Lentisphaeria bacterium]|nr:hypothetical protein [Lentisphaeria bacterium]
MGFLKKTLGTLKKGAAVLKSKTLAVIALSLAAFSSFAEGTVTLPETGVDVAGYATAAITAIGTVCGVVVAGVIAFIVVRKGIKWIRSIG